MKLPCVACPAEVCPQSTDLFRQSAPTVLRFCRLFLGDQQLAEEATIRAFAQLRTDRGAVPEGTPVRLLTSAFRESRSLFRRATNPTHPLAAAILRLGELERAVFILHAVLSIQMPWVAAIVGVSHDEATHAWAKALIELRNFLLPTGYLKERSK